MGSESMLEKDVETGIDTDTVSGLRRGEEPEGIVKELKSEIGPSFKEEDGESSEENSEEIS